MLGAEPIGHPPTLDELRARRHEILAIAARHGASNVAVFESAARGDVDERSDLDFLVDLEAGSPLDLAGLLRDLRDLLGCEVDVATRRGPRERVRDRVPAEARAI